MVRIAGIQLHCVYDRAANVRRAIELVEEAAAAGAQIVCLPELFHAIYFCTDPSPTYFAWAEPIPGPTTDRIGEAARRTRTVIVAPVFERTIAGEFYNAAAILGPDGSLLGTYRKTHIPVMARPKGDAPGGNEKFFFKPGNLGYPVFATPFGLRVGILICYDRHFPEAARALALGGADVVFVPTATAGSTKSVWELELRAHASMNVYYVCGVNRVGVDGGGSTRNHFGCSLVADPKGEVIARAEDKGEEIVLADVDPALVESQRIYWGFYRDRRPDLYGALTK